MFEIGDDVRVDSGVETGSVVSPYYDAMLAKVVAHAPTRSEAAGRLAGALRRSRIHGVTTNRDLLVGLLAEPDFLAGATNTSYLDHHDPVALSAAATDDVHGLVVAAALGLRHRNRSTAGVLARLPAGWRNNPSQPQQVVLDHDGHEIAAQYSDDRAGLRFSIGREMTPTVELHACDDDIVDVSVDGVRRRYAVQVDPAGCHVDVDAPGGSASFAVVPRFVDPAEHAAAGSLLAPMPGSVVRVLVAAGDAVEAGAPVLVLEAMKMEHTVASPATGTVAELRVERGQQVDAGSVLAVVAEDSA
jgi:acetyl/propionyl-CoA carboxylase alpha subunit